MSNFSLDDFYDGQNPRADSVNENLGGNEDLIMEQILENINTTPIGQVLKKIASLPEVRRKKVLDIRRQLAKGEYDFDERMDVALEKVLNDLTA